MSVNHYMHYATIWKSSNHRILYAHFKKTHLPKYNGTCDKMYTRYQSETHCCLSAAPSGIVDVCTLLRTLLFWDITQHWFVVIYRRFGTIYWFHLQKVHICFWVKKPIWISYYNIIYKPRLLTREEFERDYVLANCVFLETVYKPCLKIFVILLRYTVYVHICIRVYCSHV
jgi:hypothetical protein